MRITYVGMLTVVTALKNDPEPVLSGMVPVPVGVSPFTILKASAPFGVTTSEASPSVSLIEPIILSATASSCL